jgi:hypothetical protein
MALHVMEAARRERSGTRLCRNPASEPQVPAPGKEEAVKRIVRALTALTVSGASATIRGAAS